LPARSRRFRWFSVFRLLAAVFTILNVAVLAIRIAAEKSRHFAASREAMMRGAR